MDQVDRYREIVRRLIEEYASYKPAYGDIRTEAVVDRERDHYEVIQVGWHGDRRVHRADSGAHAPAASIAAAALPVDDPELMRRHAGRDGVLGAVAVEVGDREARGAGSDDVVLPGMESPVRPRAVDAHRVPEMIGGHEIGKRVAVEIGGREREGRDGRGLRASVRLLPHALRRAGRVEVREHPGVELVVRQGRAVADHQELAPRTREGHVGAPRVR